MRDWNALAAERVEPLFPGGPDDGGGQRMLARLFEAGGQAEQLGFIEPGGGHNRNDPRLALGERAGLVDDQGIDPLEDLERFGVLDQHARGGAAAGADHDRHRRGQPQRTRAGDDQDGDRVDQRMRHPRLGADESPGDKRDDGDQNDARHEVRRDLIGQALNRRAGPPRLAHHADDLGEHRIGPDVLGPHDQAAGAVDRATDHLVARSFAPPGSVRR